MSSIKSYSKASSLLAIVAIVGLVCFFAGILFQVDTLGSVGMLVAMLAMLGAGITSLATKNMNKYEKKTGQSSPQLNTNPYFLILIVLGGLFIASFGTSIFKEFPAIGAIVFVVIAIIALIKYRIRKNNHH